MTPLLPKLDLQSDGTLQVELPAGFLPGQDPEMMRACLAPLYTHLAKMEADLFFDALAGFFESRPWVSMLTFVQSDPGIRPGRLGVQSLPGEPLDDDRQRDRRLRAIDDLNDFIDDWARMTPSLIRIHDGLLSIPFTSGTLAGDFDIVWQTSFGESRTDHRARVEAGGLSAQLEPAGTAARRGVRL
jgi:hypothetical protein